MKILERFSLKYVKESPRNLKKKYERQEKNTKKSKQSDKASDKPFCEQIKCFVIT
jgi:hypothetical protein